MSARGTLRHVALPLDLIGIRAKRTWPDFVLTAAQQLSGAGGFHHRRRDFQVCAKALVFSRFGGGIG